MNEIYLGNNSSLLLNDSPVYINTQDSTTVFDKDNAEVAVVIESQVSSAVTLESNTTVVTGYSDIYQLDPNAGNGIEDAPYDNQFYVRVNGAWTVLDEFSTPLPVDSYLHDQVNQLILFKQEALGYGPDPDTRFVTVSELLTGGVIKIDGSGGVTSNGPLYMATPPAPTEFSGFSSISFIGLMWRNPELMYSNHGRTEIYRGVTGTSLNTALLVGTSVTNQFIDKNTQFGTVYRYWIRFISEQGVPGPFVSIAVDISLNPDASNFLRLLEGEIRASQLHQSLSEPIALITAPDGILAELVNRRQEILNEAAARVAAIEAEADARTQAILQEAADRGTALSEIVSLFQSADSNIISKLDLLTSATNSSFDTINLWRFDTTAEGWTTNGTPSIVDGHLIAPYSGEPFYKSPAINFDGANFDEVRIRIRKVGNPTWLGFLQYTNGATFDSYHSVTAAAPTFIADYATVAFKMSDAPDWPIWNIKALRVQLSLVNTVSDHFEIDWIGIGRQSPGASYAAVAQETSARTAAIEAEASERLNLAAQLRGAYTGNDLNEVTTGLLHAERTARANADSALAVQISSLSAGTQTQFDHTEIWYFDAGIEGWTSNSGAVAVTTAGWIRPAFSTYTTLLSPAISVDGAKYTQIRLRIRKVGNPIWHGLATYSNSLGETITGVSIAEPVFDDIGIANITFNMGTENTWVAKTITSVMFVLSTTTNASNYFDYDWIAVGRPAPGASTAELVELSQAMAAGDSANAQALATANAEIANKASQSALNSLSSEVNAIDDAVTAQGARVASLESQQNVSVINTNPSFANWTAAYPTGWLQWQNGITSKHVGAYAYSGQAALGFDISSSLSTYYYGVVQQIGGQNPEYVDLELTFTLLSGSLSGFSVALGWITTSGIGVNAFTYINQHYNAADIYNKKIVHKARLKRPANFTGTLSYLNLYVLANYDAEGNAPLAAKNLIVDRCAVSIADASAKALETLTTRVTQTEDNIALQSNQLTQLNNELAGKASTTALNSLQTTVNNQGSSISAQSSQITQLQASLPGSGNLIPTDTEFSNQGLYGWALSYNSLSPATSAILEWRTNAIAQPKGKNPLSIRAPGSVTGDMSAASPIIPVVPSKRYCFSFKGSSWRCNMSALIFWINDAGEWAATSQGSTVSVSSVESTIEGWPTVYVFGTAPAGMRRAYALVFAICDAATLGANPYLFFCDPMFSEVSSLTSAPPPYSPSGAVKTTASIQLLAEAASSTANNAVARWEVKTDVNNLQGGVGFYNDGTKTRFAIHADQFYVYSPGKNAFSLIVDGNDLVVPGGKIQARSIVTDKIQIGAATATISADGGVRALSKFTNSTGLGAFGNTLNMAFFTRTYASSNIIINATLSIRFKTESIIAAGYYNIYYGTNGFHLVDDANQTITPFGNSGTSTVLMYLRPDTWYTLPIISLIASATPVTLGSYLGGFQLTLQNLRVNQERPTDGAVLNYVFSQGDFSLYTIIQELKI